MIEKLTIRTNTDFNAHDANKVKRKINEIIDVVNDGTCEIKYQIIEPNSEYNSQKNRELMKRQERIRVILDELNNVHEKEKETILKIVLTFYNQISAAKEVKS